MMENDRIYSLLQSLSEGSFSAFEDLYNLT